MFVCLCRAVTDHNIHHAVKSGVSSFAQLQEELDVSTACGQCACEARSVFDEKIAQEASKRWPLVARALCLASR